MKERSLRQATKFSWEKSVRRIRDVYQEVLSGKGDAGSPDQTTSSGRKTTAGVA
jgi:hypothetical protein